MIKFTSLNTATEDVNLVIEPTYYQYLLTELDFKIYFCNENVKNHITEDFFLKNSKSILNHRLNGSKYKSSKNENVVINFRNAQKKKDVIKGSGIYYNRFSFYIDQSEDYGDDEVVVHFSLLITTQLDISLIDIYEADKNT